MSPETVNRFIDTFIGFGMGFCSMLVLQIALDYVREKPSK